MDTTTAATDTDTTDERVQQWAYAYADLGAKHALEVYGQKAVGRLGRSERRHSHAHRQVERYNRHTVLPAPPDADLATMLADAFSVIPPEAECMRNALATYVRDRITTGQPHDVHELIRTVNTWGCDHSTTEH